VITVGVVEDDAPTRNRMLAHLARYQETSGESFTVSSFADGRDLLASFRSNFDIVFMDIEMEHVDGMSAARRIRETDDQAIIVFVTNAPQYAIAGYEVGALSYLVKPVSYGAFALEIRRCLDRLARRKRREVMFVVDGEHLRLDTRDILYLESDKHRVTVHTLTGDHSVVGSLRSFVDMMTPAGFHRCNSGFLVNLRHVTGVHQNICRMRGGGELIISRPRRSGFLTALADHIAETA